MKPSRARQYSITLRCVVVSLLLASNARDGNLILAQRTHPEGASALRPSAVFNPPSQSHLYGVIPVKDSALNENPGVDRSTHDSAIFNYFISLEPDTW